jgi:hypothetical protein
MKKNSAAVAPGRRGGLKGGLARAARLTPAQRSASASKAVRARWTKAGKTVASKELLPDATPDTSDRRLASLLMQLRASTDLAEVRELSDKIERVVFHESPVAKLEAIERFPYGRIAVADS